MPWLHGWRMMGLMHAIHLFFFFFFCTRVAVCFLEVVVGWECSGESEHFVSCFWQLLSEEEVVTAENVNAHLHGRSPSWDVHQTEDEGLVGGPIDEGTAESLLGKDDGMDCKGRSEVCSLWSDLIWGFGKGRRKRGWLVPSFWMARWVTSRR